MKDIRSFVDYMEGRFAANIAARTVLDASKGDFGDLPPELDSRLAEALRKDGLKQLYSQQLDAFDSIRQVATPCLFLARPAARHSRFCFPSCKRMRRLG